MGTFISAPAHMPELPAKKRSNYSPENQKCNFHDWRWERPAGSLCSDVSFMLTLMR